MNRRFIIAALLITGFAGSVRAAERGPVCRLPTVVDEMAREIHVSNHYATIEPQLVAEQPTSVANIVRCDVYVELAPYDTPRFGSRPIVQWVPRGFEVRILSAGFVVRDLR